ncbi:MAG: diguanylate cyclase [Gammaproteobacteria bacterium]|nr:diguanylate cyclase [Gammaproteobacteria bacterium]
MSEESGKKQRLLIVDDSKVIRVTARKILQDHFETVEAVDGENAWEFLSNEEPFSLVVSDLTMPELDGFGLLERIRSSHIPHIQNIPVIVITGSNDSEVVKERATSAGATDFIGKPFDSVDLLARTQALASAHATTTTLKEENITLEDQLTTDPLTALANESAFMGQGYQQLSYAVRHKSSLAIFRVEIDDFGDLFKQHGESASESMIKAVATVLQSGIRHEDMAARTGTARFSLLLPGMNKAGIHNLADRINRDISARILKQGETKISFTVSIGVAAPDIMRDTRFEELLSIADSRLVHATSSGGNQIIYEDSEKQPPILQDAAEITAPAEPVPLVLEEVTASTPEPVETAVAAESELTLEDIETIETEEITLSDDMLPSIESRSTVDPDSQPAKFSGPVSEPVSDETHGPAVFTSSEPPSEPVNEPANEPAGVPASTAETGSSAESTDHFISETIVVGIPGNDFLPYEYKTETAQPPGTTEESDTAVSDAVQTATNDADSFAVDETDPGERPGFFRRLLSGIGSIFRRS